MSSPTNQNNVDLVLEGGGVKGIALLGALAVLDEHGYQPQNLAGTSAGALVATLYAAGYTHQDLYTLLMEQDFKKLADHTWLARIPLVGDPLSVVFERGVCKGDELVHLMRRLLKDKQHFRDLIHPDYADQPRYRYRVQMIAADLMGRRMLVLPRDAQDLGVNADELDVALAVRMSAGIALFYKPVPWHNPQTNADAFMVDGGILSDFPVWLFDSEGEPAWPTFGLRLVEDDPPHWLPPGHLSRVNIIDYSKRLLTTMMEGHDRHFIENDSFVRTIMIPTLGVQTTDFSISKQQSQALYDAGRKAAETFLKGWDFEWYKAVYRRKKPAKHRDMAKSAAWWRFS